MNENNRFLLNLNLFYDSWEIQFENVVIYMQFQFIFIISIVYMIKKLYSFIRLKNNLEFYD